MGFMHWLGFSVACLPSVNVWIIGDFNLWLLWLRLKNKLGFLHWLRFFVACFPSMNVWSICGFNSWLLWLKLKINLGEWLEFE